jgi:drug/metabolite transporter (DMT)-like permease
MNPSPSGRGIWLTATPALFVVLWSTGFLGAKLGLPYAEPFTFLGIRMVIATGLLGVFALATRAPWPRSWRKAGHIAVAGLLVHALYLGGVFTAIQAGLAAGVTALIVGVQPLLTAVIAGRFLEEQVTARQWLGLVLGLLGIVLVVSSKLTEGTTTLFGIGCALLALLAITLGTLYQKRFCAHMDLRSGGAIQYAVTTIAMLAMAFTFESMQVTWTGEFIFALSWLVLVLSVGAVGLLYTLIRQGAAARVASLFYLTPPLTAVLGYLLFGEALGIIALAGMVLALIGVVLVNT